MLIQTGLKATLTFLRSYPKGEFEHEMKAANKATCENVKFWEKYDHDKMFMSTEVILT